MDLQIQTSITIAAHKVDLSFPITCPTHVCTGEAQTAVRIYFSVPSNCPHKWALHLLSFIGALYNAYSHEHITLSPQLATLLASQPFTSIPTSIPSPTKSGRLGNVSFTISHPDALHLLPANCYLVASDASAVGQTCSQVVTTVDGLLLSSSLIYGSSSHGELLALSDTLPLFTSQQREIYWIIDSECVLQTLYNLSPLPLNKALKSPLAIPLAYLLMTSSSSSPCAIHFLKQESHIASPMNAVADAMAGEARRNPSTQPHY